MKIVLAGATGFIGPTLIHEYNKKGNSVVVLSRSMATMKTQSVSYVHWDAISPGSWEKEIDGADAVVNLAGESVGAKRWSEEQKKKILESRVNATRAIVQAISKASRKPEVLVNASAIGYYGPRNSEPLDESSSLGSGFLAEVSAAWEMEAFQAEKLNVRTVVVRIGIVLERGGGALSKMLPPFQYFLGGPLGSGRQWISWIHRNDLIKLIAFLIENKKARGIVNGTAPTPVTMKEFAQTLGKVLGRPAFFPTPGFFLKLMVGKEKAEELVLHGQRVLPKQAQELGYSFTYRELEPALRAILGK